MHNVQVNSEDILKRQLELAEANRRQLETNKVVAVSVMGAIGSGKTSLIERRPTNQSGVPCRNHRR